MRHISATGSPIHWCLESARFPASLLPPITFSMETSPFQVLLYYRYFPVSHPDEYAEAHRRFCEEHGLRGRIIVAAEGLNGTVSGTRTDTEAYIAALHEDPRTRDMVFKIDPADEHVFPRLSVKVRSEIVRLGLDPDHDVDPNSLTGQRLGPREFLEAMSDDDTVIIDGRNDYEAEIGRFKGAICPDIQNFREFPDWVRRHREELEGKRVLTYCTGGIRCEKLSGYLRREGFDEVYQLDGGIVTYGKDPEVRGRDFEGLCYVFDERVAVEVNHTDTRTVISRCRRCGVPVPEYLNCRWPECNRQIFLCESCRERHGIFCDDGCREAMTTTGG